LKARGFLHRTDTGITARLTDPWGHVFTLTGVPAERDGRKGYEVEVKLTGVPRDLAVPGDEESFEVIG